jgi:hypothetical protein
VRASCEQGNPRTASSTRSQFWPHTLATLTGSSDRRRVPVPDTAARLTWLATTGARLASMIWAWARAVAWVMSMSTPSAFISAISSRPSGLAPFQCGGPSISASAKALKQVWVANWIPPRAPPRGARWR